jgi:hypothetical protein
MFLLAARDDIHGVVGTGHCSLRASRRTGVASSVA